MEGWLTVKKAAKHASVCDRTLREWLKNGLRHSRLNQRTILIKAEWLDEFLEAYAVQNQPSKTINEIIKSIEA